MSLQQWAITLCQNYSGNISKKQAYLNEAVNKLLGTNYNFDEKDWAHIYSSCASNETVCPPGKIDCTIPTEKGWNRMHGLTMYFRVILEVLIKELKKQANTLLIKKLHEELDSIYKTIELLADRSQESAHNHAAKLLANINNLNAGEILCYHAGFIGHTVYLNISKVQPFGGINITICNLGGGYLGNHISQSLDPNSNRNLVYQRNLYFTDMGYLKTYLLGVIDAADKSDQNYALKCLYPNYTQAAKDYDMQYALSEISQTSGNCVIKNKLFALKHTCSNDEIYNQILKNMLAVILINYEQFGNKKRLPAKSDICYSLWLSQASFALQKCPEITDSIVESANHLTNNQSILKNTLFWAILCMVIAIAITKLLAKNNDSKQKYLLAAILGASIGAGIGLTTSFLKEPSDKLELPETSNICYSCRNTP